jgi:hypothetical protein
MREVGRVGKVCRCWEREGRRKESERTRWAIYTHPPRSQWKAAHYIPIHMQSFFDVSDLP